eukprot:CAMPEP_0196197284 /NCGR_PEP_ID=MMETSP0912-20130531/1809_1 /TAXON_ID=49265 /ORGANISM="Thalassiosira rotula, Strain GSO102" /LENGTH=77 /DNA_ID=CAMNT_0041470133 /DNA_START=91 /DNA_END=321 /DNA_ORIENTATION=-
MEKELKRDGVAVDAVVLVGIVDVESPKPPTPPMEKLPGRFEYRTRPCLVAAPVEEEAVVSPFAWSASASLPPPTTTA